MSGHLRVVALAAALACGGGVRAQNPAVDQPHRRVGTTERYGAISVTVTSDDPLVPTLVEQGLQLLRAGWSWEAWRNFREVVHRDPDCALGHLGRAIAARAEPRRAVGFAWEAYRLQSAATRTERSIVEAYARYFGAEERPDRVDPRHDMPPPNERHAALIAALSDVDDPLASTLLDVERIQRGEGVPRPRDGRAALDGRMPFLMPSYVGDLAAQLRRDGLTDDETRALARLPHHPHFPAATVSDRATLAGAGIATWQPAAAPGFDLPRGLGGRRALAADAGKPVLVVFFLGFGCVHCVEQLHALQPHAGAFRAAGIEVVTIGTDTADQVKASFQMAIENGDDPLPFDVLCDPSGASFRAWQAWDEFDDEALHGTFLVDPKGRILWQDISVEPFTDVAFLLEECPRLLAAWR